MAGRSWTAADAKLDSLVLMLGHADMQTTRIYAQVVKRIEENPARLSK